MALKFYLLTASVILKNKATNAFSNFPTAASTSDTKQ